MKRKIYDALLHWKNESNGRDALLIEGARRVGKSYIVEEFAKSEYKSYILIDFNKTGDLVKSFFENLLDDLDSFFSSLSSFYHIPLFERDTLFIFDEVQLFPKARAAIKYLVADGRYDFIETGSLISIQENIKDILIPSEEHSLKMYPMDFEEFLWAIGNNSLIGSLRFCFEQKFPLGESLHRMAMEYFRLYMLVGGMPQAVKEYISSGDWVKVDREKRNILALYRNDIGKYAKQYSTKVRAIFDEIPAQLQKHEKRFNLAAISDKARYKNYENAFFWLEDAMVINTCYNSTEPNIGLSMNMERTTLKCYMADTGLLVSLCFNEKEVSNGDLYEKILQNRLEINEGMLIENIVAQILTSNGHVLFFFSKNSPYAEERMEIDFLISKSKITNRHNISPIEVKSGTNFKTSSLVKFTSKYKDYISTPYILYPKDLKEKNGILYLPLYMAVFL